ncbi:U3 small nucleolar RNA-associated protein 6-domain-containing protein [Pilobolus umbonatus]|nr:U3 small nucleolar RNA-associated protein 6-domain-containing protein [Pilobolus umbonatus]
MAETVQYILERMLPELEELEKHHVFSPVEIKSIIKKRTNFEYALHRRIKKKIDFLRCIEYEMNLEKLRTVRIKRLGVDDKLKHKLQYTGNKRVFTLFERATVRFAGDISLWLQFIDYAKAKKAYNILSSIYVKAIKYHPRNASLWILASSWEYEHNANISAARLLLQRAIRMNPENKQLWHEYFRLELMYIEKIKMRRRVLGLDKDVMKDVEMDEAKEDGETIALPKISVEEAEEWKNDDSQQAMNKLTEETSNAMEHDINPILQGLLAQIVYKNAILAIPDDLEFRTKFIEIYKMFTDNEKGIQMVYESIENDMKDNASARACVARRYLVEEKVSLSDPAFVPALKKAVDVFESAVRELNVSAMWEEYVLFLMDWYKIVTEEHLKLYLSKSIQKQLKECEKQEKMSAKLYELWVAFMKKEDEEKMKSVLHRGLEHYPHSITLWKHRIAEEKGQKTVWKQYSNALDINPDSYELWVGWRDHFLRLVAKQSTDRDSLGDQFYKACEKATQLLPSVTKDTAERNKIKEMLQISYVEWAATTGDIEYTRKIYQKIIMNFYPTYAFLLKCLELENELGEAKNGQFYVENLYDKLIGFVDHKEESYLSYLSYLYSQKKFQKANLVYHTACKEVSNKEAFDTKVQSLNNK